MELAAIDWFKDTKRMDNVARQKGCVAQVNRKNSLEPSEGLPIGKMTTIVVKSRMAGRNQFVVPCVIHALIQVRPMLTCIFPFCHFLRLLLREGCIHLLSTYR